MSLESLELMLRQKNFSSISTRTRRNVMEITWCYVARTSPELTLRQKTLTCTSTVLQPDATLYQLLDATSQELFQRWGYVIRNSLALLLPGDHKYGKKKVWPARKTWIKCAKCLKSCRKPLSKPFQRFCMLFQTSISKWNATFHIFCCHGSETYV